MLWSAGPDLLACETIPDIVEVRALADLVDEAAATAWLTLSCADGGHLRDGTPVEEAAAIADATPGFVAVGVNCTAPEHVEELVARIAGHDGEAGRRLPELGRGLGGGHRALAAGDRDPTWTPPSARRWVAAGARLVGGCCRVGPARIRELAASLGS